MNAARLIENAVTAICLLAVLTFGLLLLGSWFLG